MSSYQQEGKLLKRDKVNASGQSVTLWFRSGRQVRQPSCEGHGMPPPLQKYTPLFMTIAPLPETLTVGRSVGLSLLCHLLGSRVCMVNWIPSVSWGEWQLAVHLMPVMGFQALWGGLSGFMWWGGKTSLKFVQGDSSLKMKRWKKMKDSGEEH